jgi:hypothetical protein
MVLPGGGKPGRFGYQYLDGRRAERSIASAAAIAASSSSSTSAGWRWTSSRPARATGQHWSHWHTGCCSCPRLPSGRSQRPEWPRGCGRARPSAGAPRRGRLARLPPLAARAAPRSDPRIDKAFGAKQCPLPVANLRSPRDNATSRSLRARVPSERPGDVLYDLVFASMVGTACHVCPHCPSADPTRVPCRRAWQNGDSSGVTAPWRGATVTVAPKAPPGY